MTFFFLQTTILTLKGPLFLQFLKSYNSYLANLKLKACEVVFLHHLRNSKGPKGTALEYFRRCETFFRKKISPKGPPFNFFLEFSDRTDVEKSKGSPLSVFRHCETFFQKNFFHQKCPSFNFFDLRQNG